MSLLFAVVAVLGAAAPAPPAVGAVPVVQDDPEARQLYCRMIDSLRAARTLSFEIDYRLNLGNLPGALQHSGR